MDVVRVGRVPFVVSNLVDATDHIIRSISAREGIPVRLANAYCVALASDDDGYCSLFRSSGVTFSDGAPVAWFMRRQNPEARTVRGPDFFERVIDLGRESGIRHFFLGANSATLEALLSELGDRFPGMNCVGAHAPGFGPIDGELIEDLANRVRAAEPDVVWVAMGTPKQDFVTSQLAVKVGVPCVGVGAAFDFVAGTVREAPQWLQGTGFEWLFRLASEPRRLWRRYLIGNLKFLYSATFQSGRSDTPRPTPEPQRNTP